MLSEKWSNLQQRNDVWPLPWLQKAVPVTGCGSPADTVACCDVVHAEQLKEIGLKWSSSQVPYQDSDQTPARWWCTHCQTWTRNVLPNEDFTNVKDLCLITAQVYGASYLLSDFVNIWFSKTIRLNLRSIQKIQKYSNGIKGIKIINYLKLIHNHENKGFSPIM